MMRGRIYREYNCFVTVPEENDGIVLDIIGANVPNLDEQFFN